MSANTANTGAGAGSTGGGLGSKIKGAMDGESSCAGHVELGDVSSAATSTPAAKDVTQLRSCGSGPVV